MVGAVSLVEGNIFRLYGDVAATGNGIAGIDAEVDQELVNLRMVDLYRPYFGSGYRSQVDILADQATQHLEHPGNFRIQVDDLGGHSLFPGKGE